MRSVLLALLSSCALAVAPVAHAWIYLGSPIVWVNGSTSIVSGTAHVDGIRLHKCGGGADDYAVDEDVDLADGFHVEVAPGDYCGVSVDWGGAVTLTGATWSGTYAENATSVTLDGDATVWAGLTPFQVTSGTFSGGQPAISVHID